MSKEVRPFEEYKEMIQDMRKEEMIRGLYDLSTRITKQENIIKEVREYIEEWQRFPHTNGSTHKELKNLIEILDKENK